MMTDADITHLKTEVAAVADCNERFRAMLWCAVRNLQKHCRPPFAGRQRPLWALVADVFGVGSTTAHELCREFGVHPDAGAELPPAEEQTTNPMNSANALENLRAF
jgi:hypothetical protein